MLLLMTVAAVACVVQLSVLGSWARSLRGSTLLMGVAVGFYACGTFAVLLQFSWTRLVAAGTGWSLARVVDVASYTADPVIEEFVKLAPLVLLGWWWRSTHRQLGLTDHLLAGAALGVGFELFEAALRFSSLRALTLGVPGGYLVSGNLAGSVVVPSPWQSLTSWQPPPAAFHQLFTSGADTVQHLVWTALAAFGLGWALRRRDSLRWLGMAGLVVACLDHANYNLRASSAVPTLLSWPSEALSWVGGQLSTLLILVLLAAVVLDRRALGRSRAELGDLLLAGEKASGLGSEPLLRCAQAGAPWSTYAAWRFVLARRALLFAAAAGDVEPALYSGLVRDRALLERARSPQAWRMAGRRFAGGLRQALVPLRLLTPTTIVWLLAIVPAVLYLVVGGFPATSGLQRAMRGPVGLGLLVASALAGAVLLALQLRRTTTALASLPTPSLHEARLRPQERIVTAVGGLLALIPMLLLALVDRDGGRRIVENYHALDALGTALLVGGLALFVASLFFFPPFALVMTSAGPLLVSTLTAELAAPIAGAGVLSGIGILLQEAADRSDSSGSGQSGESGSSPEANAARQQRIDELARDPAHGGKISNSSQAEAEVGVGLEERGQVQGLRRSTDPAEEFIDGQGNSWDVKGFHSEQGRFDLDTAMKKIEQEMTGANENIMLDTRNLSPSDLTRLREAVETATSSGRLPLRVLWWP